MLFCCCPLRFNEAEARASESRREPPVVRLRRIASFNEAEARASESLRTTPSPSSQIPGFNEAEARASESLEVMVAYGAVTDASMRPRRVPRNHRVAGAVRAERPQRFNEAEARASESRARAEVFQTGAVLASMRPRRVPRNHCNLARGGT